ncbi:FkbM family methyltransferase [Bradyrhizobium sp. B124]|uniref:FkbM family methyltransferase n=1 Tax=Bradyrhizobium sp. B124 TaxID=3140245 RepID=UPI0031831E9A
MERVAARHLHWIGFLQLSKSDGVVVHEGRNSRGTYWIDGKVLRVLWERFGSDSFTKVGEVWVDQRLLDQTMRIQDIKVVDAFGARYLANRISVIVPEAGAEIELRLCTSDLLAFRQIFIDSEYSLKDLPASASTIIDLGANIGLATLYFVARYPRATVLAVEPELENFRLLVRNTQILGTRVHRCQAAAWTHDGHVCLRTEDETNSPLDSWGVQVTTTPRPSDKQVPCYRLSTLIEIAGFSHVDILKIDIEGAELELFAQAADDCLARIQAIIIETHDRFRPGSEATVRRALAPFFDERQGRGENLLFVRKAA